MSKGIANLACITDVIRATKGFNSKNHCSGRTYNYVIPTLAFCPVDEVIASRKHLFKIVH